MAKILVLGSHAESLLNFRRDMLLAMAQHNRVIACVPDATAQIIAELRSINIEYRNVELSRTGLNPLKDLGTFFNLYKLFKEIQPDIILSYTSKPVIFGSLAAKMAGVKQIYSMITGLGTYFVYPDLKAKLVRLIMTVLYKLALSINTKVFFQNPDDINEFAQRHIFKDPKRTVLINGSGVNTDYFAPIDNKTEPVTFLLIGRFIRSKGIYEYLTAARSIKQEYPTARFLLVGWRDQKSEALNENILNDYINAGIIENLGKLEDVRPALAQASVFVLPSYREGTPRSVLEAMSSGMPIITTDAPGCRETVEDGFNGFLIPPQDIVALRQAMEKFILNPELIPLMGNNSRKIAIAKYNVHKVNQNILQAMELVYA